ncbi:hypothetical protein ADK55_27665 [Streptomyces sp. WM4235]|nr:hypothetical protein ADK55_27665 [Streptomyces sp. WM4235]
MTDDPDVRMAQSIVDYIFRRVALDFLPFETRSALGIHSAEERQRHLDTGSYEPLDDRETRAHRPRASSSALRLMTQEARVDAPLCLTCGTTMRPTGSCYVCEGCGSTSGCS